MSVLAETLPPATATGMPAPWPHQADCTKWALQRAGSIFDVGMGGGKGRIVVDALEAIGAQRVLVSCPKNVTSVWPTEINGPITIELPDSTIIDLPNGWAPRHWHTWAGDVHGARGPLANPSVAKRVEALIQANTDALHLHKPFVAIVNHEAIWQGQMASLTLGTDWDVLVIDESHRAKSPKGKAARHLAMIAERVRARGGKVIELTGTLMPHSELDVWAQMRIADGGQRLGTNYHKFCQRFGDAKQQRIPGGREITKYTGIRPDRLPEFTDLIGQVVKRVSQDDLDRMLGLPPIVEVHRTIDLDPPTRRVYDDLQRDLIADLDHGVVEAANQLVLTTRLAQLSGGFAKDPDGRLVHITDPPEKARLLVDVLEDLDDREPVVVFCRFTADLAAVQAAVERMGRTYGELSGHRRDGLTSQGGARMNPDIDVLGCQIQSGGVGINLTRARYAVFYSLDFRLGDYLQARKRLHRPGQTRRTTVVHLLARDTIDHVVYRALRRREDVITAVLDGLKTGATP